MAIERRAFLTVIGLLASIIFTGMPPTGSRADARDDVLSAYGRFAEAQNARDLSRVKELLLDAPDFLWVSDGKSVWGREALVERMARFQSLDVWRVEPLLDDARVVEVSSDVAYLHLRLDLHLGSRNAPTVTRFLVSALFRKTVGGWRIAALFTTLDNP